MQIFGEIPFIKPQTCLFKCSYSHSVQWRALTSVHMLNIPSMGSHTNILKGTAYTRDTFRDRVQMPKLQGVKTITNTICFIKKSQKNFVRQKTSIPASGHNLL